MERLTDHRITLVCHRGDLLNELLLRRLLRRLTSALRTEVEPHE